jgi:hypothetical protein
MRASPAAADKSPRLAHDGSLHVDGDVPGSLPRGVDHQHPVPGQVGRHVLCAGAHRQGVPASIHGRLIYSTKILHIYSKVPHGTTKGLFIFYITRNCCVNFIYSIAFLVIKRRNVFMFICLL